ncbi:MAG: glycosyl transferase [Chloroflexi bacterium]|nr:glycosyl transferase [Chloroflexota bacterium]
MANALRVVRARDADGQSEEALRRMFREVSGDGAVDAQFLDARQISVVGAAGMAYKAPVVRELLSDVEVYRFIAGLCRNGESVLVMGDAEGEGITVYVTQGGELDRGVVDGPRRTNRTNGTCRARAAVAAHSGSPDAAGSGSRGDVPQSVAERMAEIFKAVSLWAGRIGDEGEHIIDLMSPAPGPHFFVNVLLGDRIGYPKPLQTTPKSVVDRLGRGSFRSHAATQVLATRWDMLPEENGFPANRQLYLVEDGQQIFYSADPADANVASAYAVHSQNRTTIRYRTKCGLEITRLIFLLPYDAGLPLATEVQAVFIANDGPRRRSLKLVATGMFGAAAPGALQEDVIYTNVSMQAEVLKNGDGSIAAISPAYNSAWNREDVRFHAMVIHQDGRVRYPTEFCTSYGEFVGQGTLERPEGVRQLSNRLSRKGPGFFALGANLSLEPHASARVDAFTGLVSQKSDGGATNDDGGPTNGRGSSRTAPTDEDERLVEQVERLLERYGREGEVDRALERQLSFLEAYGRHLQIQSDDAQFDRYVNHNLPFQILYQTFVSRSFCQTQKGYREIGFREIQDLFASMPFFIAMGKQELVKELLKEWASQVFELGYAYHNFYWVGKEPGDFSDDGLWLVQAVDMYLNQTGDWAFLDEESDVAGTSVTRRRAIYETLRAILRYSGEISVGKHGMPLLDRADWNDTLRLDYDYLNGPQKEEAYRKQQAAGGTPGQPLQSDFSESVMNAFLLKVALDAVREMAVRRGDDGYAAKLAKMSESLTGNIRKHAWKNNFFARVLLNKFADGRYTYLGAAGDGLSDDSRLDGTYFLNSFNWSILANVASEKEIRTMLDVIKRVLLTPHGLKLCSPVRYRELTARGGSGEYFPGDRENGGVFKHADMMATAAMLKAAKEVTDRQLARELADLAYRIIDVVLPYRIMTDPYVLCGNPRFCTQYNNGETGENIGPILSGTSTWLWLTLAAAFGVRITPDEIEVNPILREEQRGCEVKLATGKTSYRIRISKPEGFRRARDGQMRVKVDGQEMASNRIPHFGDGRVHEVEVVFVVFGKS